MMRPARHLTLLVPAHKPLLHLPPTCPLSSPCRDKQLNAVLQQANAVLAGAPLVVPFNRGVDLVTTPVATTVLSPMPSPSRTPSPSPSPSPPADVAAAAATPSGGGNVSVPIAVVVGAAVGVAALLVSVAAFTYWVAVVRPRRASHDTAADKELQRDSQSSSSGLVGGPAERPGRACLR